MSFTKNLVEVIVMKKFLGLLAILMMISSSCLAMTFSQHVKLGSIVFINAPGFSFHDVTSNNGTKIESRRAGNYFSQGVARFGDGNDALFFHYKQVTREKRYNDMITAFGSENIRNTVNITIKMPRIHKINSDNGIIFYLIEDGNDLAEEDRYTLIGKKKDGTFIEYFDTDKIRKRYFGQQWQGIWFKSLKANENTIIINYQRNLDGRVMGRTADENGEFRFKWDEKAQWFGVEQVIY